MNLRPAVSPLLVVGGVVVDPAPNESDAAVVDVVRRGVHVEDGRQLAPLVEEPDLHDPTLGPADEEARDDVVPVPVEVVPGPVVMRHYYSTYCIHDRHGECRKTCKTCSDPCLCPCHRLASTDTGGDQ